MSLSLPVVFGLVFFGLGMLWMSLLVVQTRHARKSVLLHQLELYSRSARPAAPTKLPSVFKTFLASAAEMLVSQQRREVLHEQLAKAGKHNLQDVTDMANKKVLYAL